MLDLMMAKETLRDMFMYYEDLEFKFRGWVHALIILLFTVGTWALSNYVFNFGWCATAFLITISIFIIVTIYGSNIYFGNNSNDTDLSNFCGMIAGICMIVGLIFGLCSLLTTQSSLTKYDRFKPDTIVHTNNSVIAIFGDNTRTSYSITDYKNPNLMICKDMTWNDWNVRTSDKYYICN